MFWSLLKRGFTKISKLLTRLSYPLIQPIYFILNKNFFLNGFSSSGQNMVHIQRSESKHPVVCINTSSGLYQHFQWSVTTHPGVCNNTSRVCNSTSAVSILRNADCGCVVTDSGCVVTDSWMGRYRPLDVHHILAGNAVAIYKNIFGQNKTTQQYQGIWLYVVRSFAIFVNPLFNERILWTFSSQNSRLNTIA